MDPNPKPYGDEHLSHIAGDQDKYLVTINEEDEYGEEETTGNDN